MISSITTNLETTKKTSKDMAASSKGHGKGHFRPSTSSANSLLLFRRSLIFPLPDDYYSWPIEGNHCFILGQPRCKFIDHRHTAKVPSGPSVSTQPTSFMRSAVPACPHSVWLEYFICSDIIYCTPYGYLNCSLYFGGPGSIFSSKAKSSYLQYLTSAMTGAS